MNIKIKLMTINKKLNKKKRNIIYIIKYNE